MNKFTFLQYFLWCLTIVVAKRCRDQVPGEMNLTCGTDHAFRIFYEELKWKDAYLKCKGMQAELAYFTCPEDAFHVGKYIEIYSDRYPTGLWTGGISKEVLQDFNIQPPPGVKGETYVNKGQTWVWSNWVPFASQFPGDPRHFFADGEPNNDGDQYCLRINKKGTWDDAGCGIEKPFICRKSGWRKIDKSSLISYFWKQLIHSGNRLFADLVAQLTSVNCASAALDTVKAILEGRYNNTPANVLEEIENSVTKLKELLNDGALVKELKYTYKYYEVKMTWMQAREECLKHKSFLAMPDSEAVSKELKTRFSSRATSIWIFASYNMNIKTWLYGSGLPVLSQLLKMGNFNAGHHCLMENLNDANWYNEVCGSKLSFVCQALDTNS